MKNASGENHANAIEVESHARIAESNEINNQSPECSVTNTKIKLDMSGALQMSWEVQARKNAEEAIARFFYAENIPHAKVDSSFFHEMV